MKKSWADEWEEAYKVYKEDDNALKESKDNGLFDKVAKWAGNHGISKDEGVYNNAYNLKHKCENNVGQYVRTYVLVMAYKHLGYQVEEIDRKNAIWRIYK